MNILIVKFGALGDVVRTSYFAKCLKDKYGQDLHLTWITSPAAMPILQDNFYIDKVSSDFSKIKNEQFDVIYSLDDEIEILSQLAFLNYKKIVGAYLHPSKKIRTYCAESAIWFDMGLLSKLGKLEADNRKRANKRTHGDIFAQIFDTDFPEPFFPQEKITPCIPNKDSEFMLGINPYAGGRWSSKELLPKELEKLIGLFLGSTQFQNMRGKIILFGAGEDRQKNLEIASRFSDKAIEVANTDESVLNLATQIGSLSVLITSDSLAMHLAIAQRIPFLAFFAPTSAAEIDDFGFGQKLISTADDYCSYKKDADNKTITADRIFKLLKQKYAI